ncbi:hypothetical protein vBKpPHS106_60 [Klebsiella phage VB_KpP_HS106]|nr:hypothetical protein vBKpPHS106_60 [Klebsiella phage VB_KpP_HS106]
MAKIKLYMQGVATNEDGSEAEYVEVDEDQQYALYALGWKASEETLIEPST